MIFSPMGEMVITAVGSFQIKININTKLSSAMRTGLISSGMLILAIRNQG
jgi:hypothetical protein